AQLFSAPFDLKVASGRVSPADALAAYLPSYPLWKYVGTEDRVLLLGDWDRYHCPAAFVLKESNLPLMNENRERARREVRRLGINLVEYRSDQPMGKSLMESLKPCVELLARREPAALYRLRWESPGCASN